MDQINHFEIPAKDKEAIKKFYGDIFGWQFQEMPEMNYTIIRTVEVDDQYMPKEPGAINGGMTVNDQTAKGPVLVITVDSIDDRLEKIKSAGGAVVMEKTAVGDMGQYARVTDPEGNIIGIWEAVKKN
jgi:uncharacterized protein